MWPTVRAEAGDQVLGRIGPVANKIGITIQDVKGVCLLGMDYIMKASLSLTINGPQERAFISREG